jgi:hypothetical protein
VDKARVLGQADVRSYGVRTEDGREYRRNRRFLRKTNERFEDNIEPISNQSSIPEKAPVSTSSPPAKLSPPENNPQSLPIVPRMQVPDAAGSEKVARPRPIRAKVSTRDTIFKDFVAK